MKKHIYLTIIFVIVLTVGFLLVPTEKKEAQTNIKFLGNSFLNENIIKISEPNPKLAPYSIDVVNDSIKITGNEWSVSFQPQFYLQNGNILTWQDISNNYPNIEKRLWKIKLSPTRWKYGVDFYGITDAQKNALQFVILHRTNAVNIAWDDISIKYHCITFSASVPEVVLCHDDILSTYTIPLINRTDIVIGNLSAGWVYDDLSATWNITFDPVVTISGDDIITYANLVDVNADANISHLNLSETEPWNHLVFYHPFDGIANKSSFVTYDWSENNNDCTAGGQTEIATDCKYGTCAKFDANDYINCGAGDNITENLTGITASVWFKANNSNDGHLRIIYQSGLIDLRRYGDETYWCEIKNQTADAASAASPIVHSDTDWHHIVCRYNGSYVQLFVDTVQQDNTPPALTGLTRSNNENLYISAAASGANGLVDDVMIFNTSLTEAQIIAIYNNQSNRFKETGTMRVMAINISNTTTWQDNGFGLMNATISFENNFDSNLSMGIGQINISVDPTNLTLYMPFEFDSAADISGKENHGTIESTVVYNSTGGLNGTAAYEFESIAVSQDWITIGTGSDYYNLCSGSGCSMGAWVKLRDTDLNAETVLARYDPTNNNQFFYLTTGGITSFRLSHNGSIANNDDITSYYFTTLKDGQWHHIFATFNRTHTALYIDGDRKDLDKTAWVGINETAWQDSESTFIGVQDDSSNTYPFNGTIDNVMLFSRPLSSSEIKSLYENQSLEKNFIYYTDYQNLTTSGSKQQYVIDTEADFILPIFKFYAGNKSNSWYSPVLNGSIVFEIGESIEIDNPPTSNSPADASYNINDLATIAWTLTDDVAGSMYNVTRNGTIQNESIAWTSGVAINVWVNTTDAASGSQWNYTVFYNDSAGQNGAQDEVLITINSSTSITNCTDLDQSGTTYTLSNDILNSPYKICLNVTASSVTIDCAGYRIDGIDTSSTYGIHTNQYNTTIKNCNMSDWQFAVFLNTTNHSTVQDSEFNSNKIFLSCAIAMDWANYTYIDNITANDGAHGILNDESWYVYVNNSRIRNMTTLGIFFDMDPDHSIIENTNITGSLEGVEFNYADNVTFRNNNISNSTTCFTLVNWASCKASDYTQDCSDWGYYKNYIYNNFFNCSNLFVVGPNINISDWNVTKQVGDNIYNKSYTYIGGNFYGNQTSLGFSQTCTDADLDGFCDTNYTITAGNIDYLPISIYHSPGGAADCWTSDALTKQIYIPNGCRYYMTIEDFI